MPYFTQLEPLDEYNRQWQSNVHPLDWKNPTPQERYNLVVIGAGTAGLVAAAGAAGLGAKVALIERGLMGGDCLNVGCVPSKALISAARQITAIRSASKYGIETGEYQVDFASVMQRMRRIRASISPHDSAKRFSELGIDVYLGQGVFTGRDTVEVAGQTIRFKKAVITTGARAAELPIPGLKEAGYLTNETVFSLTELPKRLIVIGGGPIGCELAQCFARFGTKVALVEKSARILSKEDEEAALLVQQAMQHDGVQLELETKVLRVFSSGEGKIVVVEQQGEEKELIADEIFVGIGRTPNVEELGLDAARVNYDPETGVDVDDRLRTSNKHIFAAGDVCSKYKFTHAADFLARIVIQNALFMGRAKASSLIIPWCTYTSPELAHVGILPAQAEQMGMELTTFTQPFTGVDRAVIDGQDHGFARIHCRKGSSKIVGATIVAQHAGDMISEVVMAMKHGLGLDKVASVIHPYPTQSDAIRKLGDQYNRTRLTPFVKSLFDKWLRWTR